MSIELRSGWDPHSKGWRAMLVITLPAGPLGMIEVESILTPELAGSLAAALARAAERLRGQEGPPPEAMPCDCEECAPPLPPEAPGGVICPRCEARHPALYNVCPECGLGGEA